MQKSEPEFVEFLELIEFLKTGTDRKLMDTIKKSSEEFNDCTGKIIGCAMKVHSTLGNGFQEVIYQRALEIEMCLAGLGFIREMEMPIFYREEQIGTRRVDFFVDGEIMVELKALIALEDVHLAQGLNYLEAYNVKTGLLLNFGGMSLQIKRLVNKKYVEKSNRDGQY